MSSQTFKVPKFLSKAFSEKTEEGRTELIAKYKSWYEQEVTELWMEGLQSRADTLVKEDELLKPSSSFEFQQGIIENRTERRLVRSLLKEINYKD